MQKLLSHSVQLLRQFFYTLIALCSYFVMQPAYADLKVLSFNFGSEITRSDTDHKIRDRKFAAIIAWVEEKQPDVLLIQGGWSHHPHQSVAVPLATATGYDVIYKVTSGGPIRGYDSTFIMAKKKYAMAQPHIKKLPHSPLMGEPSFAVGARITLQDGSPVYLYTAKLNALNDSDRSDQLSAIHKTIEDHVISNYDYMSEAKIVLAGDFGSPSDSLSIVDLTKKFYRDSFAKAHPGVSACTLCSDPLSPEFNPLTSADKKNSRPDYVFSHGYSLQTRASTVVFSKSISGLWMSDHSGVYTTFATNNPPGDIVGSVPNPVYDQPQSSTLTKVIYLNDNLLKCSSLTQCTHALSDSEVSTERGVTFVNQTRQSIRIQMNGSGETYTRTSQGPLKPGKSRAYFFEPQQRYDFTARKVATRKRLVGTLFSKIK